MQKDHDQHNSGQVFNMSLATLSRIDSVLSVLNNPMIIRNVLVNTQMIKGLYMEVYPFLNDSEKEEGDKMLSDIYRQYKTINDETRVNKVIHGKISTMEFWLRQKLNDKGLLMAKAEDPGIALGRG